MAGFESKGNMGVSQDLPQDQAAPQSVGDWEAHQPLLIHSGREPIPASEDNAVK